MSTKKKFKQAYNIFTNSSFSKGHSCFLVLNNEDLQSMIKTIIYEIRKSEYSFISCHGHWKL